MTARVCIGFGDREGTCTNEAGTPWTPLWCPECDENRRASIRAQLKDIAASLASSRPGGRAGEDAA